MNIYYDTEFLEDGTTIRPISIGMVRDDGKEYYAVFRSPTVIYDAHKHPWVRKNVLPYLPLAEKPHDGNFVLDHDHPDVKYKEVIAEEVKNFISEVPEPSLWAYFASYDHVLLAQLYGKMIQMPPRIPQRTNDIAQEIERLGYNPGSMPGVQQHNALSDAREVKWIYGKLREHERTLAARTS